MSLLLTGHTSERLRFRTVRQSDFPIWLPFFADPETSRHWQMPIQSPDEQCAQWYRSQFHRYDNGLGGMNALLEKTTGHLVGHCGLLVQRVDGQDELEIGYSLLPQYWGHGYATEAARCCRDYAFSQQLSGHLIAIISTTNLASERVARAIGMQPVRQTIYHDNQVNIFRIDRDTWCSIQSCT